MDAALIGALKNFATFKGKHLCWGLFFTNLQAFRPEEQVLSRTSPVTASIYLRTLNRCRLQYVGEIVQMLNERLKN